MVSRDHSGLEIILPDIRDITHPLNFRSNIFLALLSDNFNTFKNPILVWFLKLKRIPISL